MNVHVCTQVSEDDFAGVVGAQDVHSLAGSCFHADVRHRQKLHQDLLHILLLEQFVILSYTQKTHTDKSKC